MVYLPSLTVMAAYTLSCQFLMATLCSFSDLPKITSWSLARLRADREAPASSWAPARDFWRPAPLHLPSTSVSAHWANRNQNTTSDCWKPRKETGPKHVRLLLLRKRAMGLNRGGTPGDQMDSRPLLLSPSVSFPRVLIRGFSRHGHWSKPKTLIQTAFSFTITCFPFYMPSTALRMVANWFKTIFSQPWAFWKWTSVKW